MKAFCSLTRISLAGLLVVALAGCATYDRRANNTMLGAGLGAATGAVVGSGDPVYMLGGAAAGGLLGNILTEDRRHYRGKQANRGNRWGHGQRHYRNSSRGWNSSHKWNSSHGKRGHGGYRRGRGHRR